MGAQVTITPDQAASGPVTITPDEPSASAAAPSYNNPAGYTDPRALLGQDAMHALSVAGEGAADTLKSLPSVLNPIPQNTVEKLGGLIGSPAPLTRMASGVLGALWGARQVPAAIKDINASPDPAQTYSDVASRTAGQALTQAGLSKGAEAVSDIDPHALKTAAQDTAVETVKAALPKPVKEVLKFNERYQAAKAGNSGAPDQVPKTPEVAPTVQQPQATPAAPLSGGAQQSAVQSPVPEPITRGYISQILGEQLNKSLGATELDPKMALRQQLDKMRGTKPAPDVPEGHTPVQSSALRSYKYDPAAKEFHARYSSGDSTTHVFGDVDPEEAQAFQDAESKGKAMQQIKQGHPLVAKIVGGKRIAVKGSITPQ